MQVCLEHFVKAFAPHGLENPLVHGVSNGAEAVDIFFLLSGAVLTYSFERYPRDVVRGIYRRIIRLGVPLLVACLLALALRMVGAEAMHRAAATAGSPWLSGNIVPLSLVGAVADGSVWTVFGFADTTLFGWVAPHAPVLDSAIDPPIWSLHVEFWGSILVLLVVAARSSGTLMYRTVLVGAVVVCGPF